MDSATKPIKTIRVSSGLSLCVILLILWAAGSKILVHFLFPGIPGPTVIFISRILFWLYLLAMWLYAIKVEKLPLLLWSEKKYGAGVYIVSSLLLLLVVIIGMGMITVGIKYLNLIQQSAQLKALANLGVPLKIFIAITAAVGEELIFRGYLISRLQLYFKNTWLPVVISALIFGLAHISYGTVINVAGPLYIGLVFGFYYQKYRNIKVLILCHFLIDFTALLLMHSK